MTLELGVVEGSQVTTGLIIEKLNQRFTSKDDFEMRIDIFCLDIAAELGLIYERQDETLLFIDKQITNNYPKEGVMKYVFHSDPGHAWLEVKKAELVRLGITDIITSFSYMRGDKVYLEEDCDYPTFLRAKEAAGETVAYVEKYQAYSPIRGYDHYE